jgi:hypothetical protein
VETA